MINNICAYIYFGPIYICFVLIYIQDRKKYQISIIINNQFNINLKKSTLLIV